MNDLSMATSDNPLFLPNTLVAADAERTLVGSLWMTDPDDVHKYHDFALIPVEPVYNPDIMSGPIPLHVDPATLNFLRSRPVAPKCTAYQHADGTKRIRVTGFLVFPPVEGQTDKPITDSFDVFLERFLASHCKQPK